LIEPIVSNVVEIVAYQVMASEPFPDGYGRAIESVAGRDFLGRQFLEETAQCRFVTPRTKDTQALGVNRRVALRDTGFVTDGARRQPIVVNRPFEEITIAPGFGFRYSIVRETRQNNS
jgi:hypothetical protein